MSILEQMLEDFGLLTVMEQNDLEEIDVLEILVERGLINLDDYIFDSMENVDD